MKLIQVSSAQLEDILLMLQVEIKCGIIDVLLGIFSLQVETCVEPECQVVIAISLALVV